MIKCFLWSGLGLSSSLAGYFPFSMHPQGLEITCSRWLHCHRMNLWVQIVLDASQLASNSSSGWKGWVGRRLKISKCKWQDCSRMCLSIQAMRYYIYYLFFGGYNNCVMDECLGLRRKKFLAFITSSKNALNASLAVPGELYTFVLNE